MMLLEIWDGEPVEPRPKRRRRKYGAGTDMTEVMDVLQSDRSHSEAVDALILLYAWVDAESVSAVVYDGRRALARRDLAETERLAYEFSRRARRSQPEPEQPPRQSWLRRLLRRGGSS